MGGTGDNGGVVDAKMRGTTWSRLGERCGGSRVIPVWVFMPHRLGLETMCRAIDDMQGLKVACALTNDAEWPDLSNQSPPRVAVVSYDMDMPSGSSIVRNLRSDYQGCGVVVVSRRVSDLVLADSARAGANTVVSMNQSIEQLERQINSASRMEWSLDPVSVSYADARLLANGGDLLLDADEVDLAILRRLTLGLTDQQISDEIYIAVQSVKNRISRMLDRYQKNNRTQLAIFFERQSM